MLSWLLTGTSIFLIFFKPIAFFYFPANVVRDHILDPATPSKLCNSLVEYLMNLTPCCVKRPLSLRLDTVS